MHPRAAAPAVPQTTEAFGEWVGPHVGVMANLAARLASDAARDDVVQEALLRAWKKRHLYDPARGELRTWLLAITADQARRSRRRAAQGQGLLAQLAHRGGSIDERLDIESAVSRLPRRQRLAVNCFYFADLSVAETAVVMRCSTGTVKSTLADARARIKELLDG